MKKIKSTKEEVHQIIEEENEQNAFIKQKNEAEIRVMEKMFNGSCCHSGIHAYQKKSN